MNSIYGAINTRVRREAPQPLGSTAQYFSVSAATPIPIGSDPHPSTISLRLKLNSSSHPTQPFQTGELVQGNVHIYVPSPGVLPSTSHLSFRVYFESRTLFWSLELVRANNKVSQQLQNMKSAAAQNLDRVIRHEVHRGVVPSENTSPSWAPGSQLKLDFQPMATPSSDKLVEAVLPFSFVLPRTMSVTEYSEHEDAPRDLCSLERCPPPMFRDSRDASVQWVVEAVLQLYPDSTPVQDDAMLRQSTDKEVVTRLVFPVVPAPQDVGSLRHEPFFGDDPELDSFGTRRLSKVEQESVKKATLGRVRARGGSWDTYVRNIRLSTGKHVASEVYINEGVRISTDTSSFPLLVYLKEENSGSSSISSFFRSSKPKGTYLQRVLVTLSRTTSTRGGKEVKPHTTSALLRQQEHRYDESAPSTSDVKPGLLVPSGENGDALELDLTFDLQNEAIMDLPGGTRKAVAAKHFTPSFRTPNIQHEYLLTISLWFPGDNIERYAARLPVQFVPGDENELPTFEDATNASTGQPPAFEAADTQLPQY